MTPEALTRLRRNLDAATDDALAALANRGLVRRAAKDLQQAGAALTVEEREESILVRGEDWTVTMPAEGPAAATDDTPATGVTRQILAATMFLRDHWQIGHTTSDGDAVDCGPREQSSSDPALEAAVTRLQDASADDLFQWAGKLPVLEAAAAFPSIGEAVIARSPQLTIQFSVSGIQVVLMTDRPASTLRRLLDQCKSTAKREEHARWVMLGVLALKRAAGKSTQIENDPGRKLTEVIREDRRRISLRARNLLHAMAASGTAHPSSRIVERLRTTGVAAEAARFPRLARLLHSIADDAQLQLNRTATADPARMVQRMVIANALAESAARNENAERTDLFGQPRTAYSPAGDLPLCGLGAHGWRTASGFQGLTVIFWDLAGNRFLTATVSRGQGQDPTFSIPRAYERGMGWSGSPAIQTLCRHRLTLHAARINADGRLSVAESCRAVLDTPTDPSEIDFGDRMIVAWNELGKILCGSQPIGLRLPDPRSAYVVIRPAKWGARWFDELAQAFVWELHDESGAAIKLLVPWTETDEDCVGFLESLKVDRDHPTMVLGRLQIEDSTLHVYPLSIFSSGTSKGDKILCPQFDQPRVRSRNEALLQRLRKKFQRQPTVRTQIGDAESDEGSDADSGELADLPPLFRHLIADVDQVLSTAIESGAGRLVPAAERTLAAARDRFQSLGVTPMAETLHAVLQPPSNASPDMLRAAYRLHLFQQSLRLARIL